MKFKIFNASEFLRTNAKPNLLKEIELEYKPSIREFIKYETKICEIMKIIHNDNFIELYIEIPEINKIEIR